jgi:hypothetical protein
LALLTTAMVGGSAKSAQSDGNYFSPGNLVVSRSVYDNNPNNLQEGVTAAAELRSHFRLVLPGRDGDYRWHVPVRF